MENQVATRDDKTAAQQLFSLSSKPILREAISDPMGFSGTKALWELPEVTKPLQELAKTHLASHKAITTAAPKDWSPRHWLASLAPLLATQGMTLADLKTKLISFSSLPSMAGYPAYCFSPETLDAFARHLARPERKFQGFPTYGEVCDYLDGVVESTERELGRCRQIAEFVIPPPTPKKPPRVPYQWYSDNGGRGMGIEPKFQEIYDRAYAGEITFDEGGKLAQELVDAEFYALHPELAPAAQ